MPRWAEPIGALEALRTAVRALAIGSDPVKTRLDRATYALSNLRTEQVPPSLQLLLEHIRNVRISVRQDYVDNSLFHFERLTVAQQRLLIRNVIALYEACLLDIGKMEVEYYDIVYPKEQE